MTKLSSLLGVGFSLTVASTTVLQGANQAFSPPVAWGTELTHTSGWQPARHPRLLADVNGDGKQDLVGFGDAGVWTALSTGSSFAPAKFVVAEFGYNNGWRVEKHIRLLTDINHDGKADLVAFGDGGVWTALALGDGGFAPAKFVLAEYGYDQGWRIDSHVRLVADVNGDGYGDIVGFKDDGVWLSLGDGHGGFGAPKFAIQNFATKQGWNTADYVRLLVDINGDGKADVVAFGYDGVWTALSNGAGFDAPKFVLADFGFNQGWRAKKNPRYVLDVDHDGKPDIVGFGDAGIWISHSTQDGGFTPAIYVSNLYGANTWGAAPRLLADLNGDGYPDVIAFGNQSISGSNLLSVISRSLGGPAGFGPQQVALINFADSSSTYAIGDLNGDGKQDLANLDFTPFLDPELGTKPVQLVAISLDSPQIPPPFVPTNLKIGAITPTSIATSWDKGSATTRYYEFHYTGNNQQGGIVTASHHAEADQLASNTQYCFDVRAIGWFGVSGKTPSVCGRTLPQPTTPWTNLNAYEIYLDPTFPSVGQTTTITWLEWIQGTKTPGAYTVRVYHDDKEIYHVRRPAGLGFGQHLSTTLSTDVVTTTAGSGDHVIKVVLDTENEVPEITKVDDTVTYTYHPLN